MVNTGIDSVKNGYEDEEGFVKLLSADGCEFILSRRVALVSVTMKAMLEGQFREADDATISFPEMSGLILEKVVQYLHYKVKFSNSPTRVPEFKIDPEHALELLVAANYLDC
mmetsp:Transcript_29586/g.34043  ORF Transcript_29586/g.34043 Transcript_29586/m.34043 type:complete len:112 (-) Transcript_29586:4-339(-)